MSYITNELTNNNSDCRSAPGKASGSANYLIIYVLFVLNKYMKNKKNKILVEILKTIEKENNFKLNSWFTHAC